MIVIYLPLVSREWKNGGNSSFLLYPIPPFPTGQRKFRGGEITGTKALRLQAGWWFRLGVLRILA